MRGRAGENFLKKVSPRPPSKTFLTEMFWLRRTVKQKRDCFYLREKTISFLLN